MTDSEAKKLNELRVVDLKYELEKREIDTAGVKAVLLKKLHKALVDEGLDPDTHMFPVEVDGKGTPLKKKKGEEEEEEDTMKTEEKKDDEVEVKVEAKSAEEEKGDGKDEKEDAPKEETPSKEAAKDEDEKQEKTKEEAKEVIVKKEEIDEVKDVAEKETPSKDAKKVKAEDAEGDSKEDTQEEGGGEEKKQDEETEERDELEVLLEDKDMEDDMEGADHKEVDDDEAIELKDKSDVNGMDAEDSIHLTIGEDEEKLMAGEDDLVEKHKDASAERSGRGSKKQDTRKNDARSISPDNSTDDKGKKSNYRNLWVSGLAAITRAQDLKHIFSKLGKVVAAKVVTNAKTPGARCYGFVTMATAEDAQACIKGLNLTELHGRLISVEAVANKPVGSNAKKPDDKRKASLSPQREEKRRKRDDSEVQSKDGASDREDKKRGENADKESSKEDDAASKAEGESGKEPEGSERGGDGHTSDKGAKSGSPARRRRPPIRERLGERPVPNPAARRQNRERIQIRGTRTDVLSFAQIKEERERQRMREKERAQREEERRRREELDRQRLVERRQRDELVRLEREREKVRQERLRLEKEKAELLRLERERLEREKEDLKRQQAKLEEAKRAKRAAASRYIEEERKRPTVDAVRRYEPVGPPRSKEPRRESPPPPPSSRSRYEEGSRREDAVRSRREEPPPRPKESMRYVERAAAPSSSSSTFRSSREDRGDRERDRREREEPHRKSESSRMHREPRYEAPPPSKSDHRYGSESWAGSGSGGSKTFGSSSGSSSRPESSWMSQDRKSDLNPWARGQPSQSDRWPVSGGSSLVSSGSRSAMYGMNMALGGSMGLSGVMPSPFPPTDRYDAYKPMGGSMGRKY